MLGTNVLFLRFEVLACEVIGVIDGEDIFSSGFIPRLGELALVLRSLLERAPRFLGGSGVVEDLGTSEVSMFSSGEAFLVLSDMSLGLGGLLLL